MDKHLIIKKYLKIDPETSVEALSWASLHDFRSKLRHSAEAILKTAETEKRDLNSQENLAYTFAVEMIDKAQSEFDTRSRVGVKEPEEMSKPVKTVKLPDSENARKSFGLFRTNLRYRDLYGSESDNGGFESMDDFYRAVYERRSSLEKIMTSGGALVPTQFAATIFDSGIEQTNFAQRCSMFPLTGPELLIPALDGEDHTSTLYGGFAAQWSGEAVTNNETEPTFRAIRLVRNKLTVYTSYSRELSQDAGYASVISPLMGKTIGWFLDNAILNGTGVNQPKGILSAACKIPITRAAANSVGYADIVNMYIRQLDLNGAVWVCNKNVYAKLLTMQDAASQYMWQVNAVDGVPLRILGLPVIDSEKVPSLGTEGDLSLINFKYVGCGIGPEISFETQNATYWSSDKVAARSIIHVAAACMMEKPVTPQNGETLSPIVVLR